MSAMITLIEKLVFLGLLAIALGILFAIFFSKSIVGPLKELTLATGRVASGNFNLNLTLDSQDEIGTLAKSFNVMSKKIQELIKESIEKTRLESEIKVASTVQQTLFPPTEVKGDRFEIVSTYQSASECGGDWWGYFEARGKLFVFIGDATGHGIPSALITASARSCFSIMHKLTLEDNSFGASPGQLLSFANRAIHDSSHGKIMMTFFVGEFDFESAKLRYAVAAHNPPWLFRPQNGGFKIVSLGIPGERLGEKMEVPPYEEKETEFGSGDLLFLYTDGLIEGKSRTGEEYGKKRARKFAEDHAGQGPKSLIEKIMMDFKTHNGTKPFDDDVTLAAVRIK